MELALFVPYQSKRIYGKIIKSKRAVSWVEAIDRRNG